LRPAIPAMRHALSNEAVYRDVGDICSLCTGDNDHYTIGNVGLHRAQRVPFRPFIINIIFIIGWSRPVRSQRVYAQARAAHHTWRSRLVCWYA